MTWGIYFIISACVISVVTTLSVVFNNEKDMVMKVATGMLAFVGSGSILAAIGGLLYGASQLIGVKI